MLVSKSGKSYKLPYETNNICTIRILPIIAPIKVPNIAALKEYITYLVIIVLFLYPNAFRVPKLLLSFSIILDIVVIVTKAATTKNITGNILPIIAILDKSSFKDLKPVFSYRGVMVSTILN